MPSGYGEAMKPRSRAGGKASKARGREASKTKRRNASKTASSSAPVQHAEVARLTRELNEARQQQTASSNVLQVISTSGSELDPVFKTILANATRICEAKYGNLYLFVDGAFQVVAAHSRSAAIALERLSRSPFKPAPSTALGRMFRTKATVQIDLLTDQDYPHDHPRSAALHSEGVRTLLCVPMIKGDELIGAITIFHKELLPFTDKQIELVKNFAAQAVIAIENARLLNELRQRTTDLTERTADLTEALEQQTATSEVLRVISSSPGDLQPVFDALLANATRLCEASYGAMWLREGDRLRIVASYGTLPEAFLARWRTGTVSLHDPDLYMARAVRSGRPVQVDDLRKVPAYLAGHPVQVSAADIAGIRTFVAVPMFKDKEAVGNIVIYRKEVRPFTDKQIALVTNFAAQAVIAIENARLLNELRQRTTDLTERTADLTEALEQQTATSEVLQVISSSPGDLQPVFATMLEKAVRICDATFGNIYRWESDALHVVATQNAPPVFAEARRLSAFRPSPKTPTGRMIANKRAVHTADLRVEEAYADRDPWIVAGVELGGVRTVLMVPMLREDELIGALSVYRQEVRPFTDKQIALVENFAAQAVIAIENARLLNELRQRTDDLTGRTADLTEALEQQTATSEVLQVVSSSPGNLEPVFAIMLEKAVRICDAEFGHIFRRDGDALHLVAAHNTPPAFAELRKRSPLRATNNLVGRMTATKTLLHVTDLAADPSYAEERDPTSVDAVEVGGIRALLLVPLLKEGELVGSFTVYRQEVRPFTDKQIELVQNFAAQAVIAIENARLLNELRQRTTDLTERTADLTEALEQQTATSEVLQVISSSPGDLEPAVFAAMLEKAVRICDAAFGSIYRWKDEGFLIVATHHNTPAAFIEIQRHSPYMRPRNPGSIAARMLATKSVLHVADLATHQDYERRSRPIVAAVELGGVRTLLAVPMMKENEVVGAFTVYRHEVRPFTDKQIALVTNFAAQAVIAIENARLLNELRERTGQLEVQSQQVFKLNQQLEQRVTDQVGEIERMGRLRRFLPPQVADLIVASGAEKQLESHRREITALFCDLRGFTGFSESADPEDVMTVLREYHEALGASIIKYSGTLERYAGDGVMVVFNDPVPVENPALQAVLMALEMRDAIGALTETWRRWGHDIGFGIGIAHGFATLGTIGFEGRFDYAAIGTVSNVASRLCDEAKPGQILISPRVLTKVENAVKVEPVGEFELKGIRRPLAAYNVVAAAS